MSAQNRATNVLPPEQGKILAITLDGTSRVYDLGALAFGGEHVERGGTCTLRMISDGAYHYKFGPTNSMTVDETTAVAAGGSPAFSANAAVLAPANASVDIVSWNRLAHRYLAVKGGTSILRIWVSSEKTSR